MPDSMVRIRPLSAAEAEARLDELADILVDAVASGAGVNFMAGFTQDEGRAFWCTQLPGLADGSRHLFVADEMLGPRLLSLHNVHFLVSLVRRARAAIVAGTFRYAHAL